MKHGLLGLCAPLVLISLIACGSKTNDDGTGGSTGGSGGGSSCNPPEAENSEWCASNPGTLDCTLIGAAKGQVCGVALPGPVADITRSSTVKEFAGSGAPDVSCFETGHYPDPPASSQTVTISGVAKIFSNGCQSNSLKITFYKVKRTGGDDDGSLGDAIGTPITTAAECQGAPGTVNEPIDTCDNSLRYECAYSYPGLPSETELAVKTEGAPDWAPLIQYNVYVPNSAIKSGVWNFDVRALSAGDFVTIPQAAIGGPVGSGNGIVAGEVHDCGNVRLSNAVADVDKFRTKRTYFTSNEDSPLPDQMADGTSDLGLYAAFDIKPGPITVAAMGQLGGKNVDLGQFKAFVYPGAVSIVTFEGMKPFQVPAK